MTRYHNLAVLLCFTLLITKSLSTPVSKKLISCHDCLYVVRQVEAVVKTGGLAAIAPEIEMACMATEVADPVCVLAFMAVFTILEDLAARQIPPKKSVKRSLSVENRIMIVFLEVHSTFDFFV